MKAFLDSDFLLSTATAKHLYHDYAEKMPIIDYHCHINPQEIAENRRFDNITQIWLGGDHYKWRLIRANGVQEHEITGTADDRVKFQRFAETLPKAVGNPLYHWTQLELKRYFGYDGVLSPATADEVWEHCNKVLETLTVRDIIKQSGVETIVTTDDPADDLRWHRQIRDDKTCSVKVLPAWRPDKALNIEKPDFTSYLDTLGKAADLSLTTVHDVKEALHRRLDAFAELGCCASDHGLDYVVFAPASDEEVEQVFARKLAGDALSQTEIDCYKYALLNFLAKEYAARGWVMQLHYGVLRNANSRQFSELGPDTGFDCISGLGSAKMLAGFLNELDCVGALPKTIVYSLNPNDNALIDTVIGCFQGTGAASKLQHGSAWWFCDTKKGMEEQMESLANLSLLGNFVGMLTDSRSFLSYTRHEYFRRILCNLVGNWVENGEFPNDMETLGKLVQDISYNNTKSYFGF